MFTCKIESVSSTRRARASGIERLESRTLLSAGDLNLAFGGGDGRLLFSPPSGGSVAMSVATQSDGKFVLAGSATSSGKKVLWLERLNAKGNLDKSFGCNGIVKQSISNFVSSSDITRQSDGKFIVAGSTKSGGFVARFTSCGKLDTTLGGGAGVTFASFAPAKVIVLPNGKIAAADSKHIAEFNSDGSVNKSFGSNGIFDIHAAFSKFTKFDISGLAGQKDNKIVLSATAVSATSSGQEWAAIRVTSSGKVDTSFDHDGVVEFDPTGLEDASHGVAIQSTGRIILVGNDDNSNTLIVGLNSDGSSAFSTKSDWSSSFSEGPSNVIVDSSDRIIVIGHTDSNDGSQIPYYDQDFAIQRLSATGAKESQKVVDFATYKGGSDDYAYAVGIAGDGNIVVVGENDTDSPLPGGELVEVASIQGKPGGPSDKLPVAQTDTTLTVTGTSGNDSITITPDDRGDVFVEFNGNVDHYYLGGRNIVVNAGAGNDRMEITSALEEDAITLNGGSGNDTLIGSNPSKFFSGGPETFIGGPGNDTADYSARADNLNISLDNVANDGAAGEHDNVMADIENILGGSGNDKLVGNPFNNLLKGNTGNDTLYGGAGNDTLDGGSGRDYLYGQDGNDTLLAKDGRTDSLDGGNGFDTAQRDNSSTIKDSVLNIESFI